jgi:nondiscriminating glutamyl-tRNA synthetase
MNDEPVRVRFAPSPTGWLHVGGARTAYFNWLFARRHGGAFVLRIEDTDVERSSASSEQGVLDDLAWLGLDWDEGPDRGGPHAPYRQSERLPLYREHAELLLARGMVFPCFCTDEELAVRRAEAAAAGRPPHYDGRCRQMTRTEREAGRTSGRPESLRFAVEPRAWRFDDLVRGEVAFPAGMVGDFVVLRSSGLPTYNFACAVDDHAMRISHVIRAEEHLSNTLRQLMLFEAFGARPPRFAHVPLILNADRTKMSKRAGEAAVAVGDWRRAGYAAEALLAYLAFLGFHPGEPGGPGAEEVAGAADAARASFGSAEILSREALIRLFSLERVGRSGSVFDPQKLAWINATILHHASGAMLRAWRDDFLPEAARALSGERLETALELVRGNLSTLADLPAELEPLLAAAPALDPDAAAVLADPAAAARCVALAADLGGLARRRNPSYPRREAMKVAVLMGGRSSEREISLRTGRGVAQSLRQLGHEVAAVDAGTGRLLEAGHEEEAAQVAALERVPAAHLVSAAAMRDADVVFIALHGGEGENGTLQALLELAGKPYTGSGVLASALAMNKAVAKRLFEHEGIPTPPWQLVRAGDPVAAVGVDRLGGLPLVVKPNEEGSTVGLSVVRAAAELPAALARAAAHGPEILIERFIPGRELTVAVLGEEALPIVEIRPQGGLYDYESKYTAGRSEYDVPAPLEDDLAARIRDLGVRAARVLGCAGVSRADFRLDPENVPYCLEVNTIPGMTPTSLVPMAARARGMSYDELVDRLLGLAVEDHRRRSRRVPTGA